MSAATQTRGRAAGVPHAYGKAAFAGALRSEFTKLRSVRSTYWTLLALVVVTVGLGALGCYGAIAHSGGDAYRPGFDATQRSLFGLIFGQLIISVLGALTVTSEYSTGMIRTSLSVQPHRTTLLAAKGLVFAAVTLVIGLGTAFASFFVGQAILSTKHLGVTLGEPNVLRAVIGAALFLTLCGMLAFGLGAVLRSTAAAITASVGLLFVLFILVNFLPANWQAHVDKWVPFNAGRPLWATVNPPGQDLLAPWTGFAALVLYAAIAIGAGLLLFHKRDA